MPRLNYRDVEWDGLMDRVLAELWLPSPTVGAVAMAMTERFRLPITQSMCSGRASRLNLPTRPNAISQAQRGKVRGKRNRGAHAVSLARARAAPPPTAAPAAIPPSAPAPGPSRSFPVPQPPPPVTTAIVEQLTRLDPDDENACTWVTSEYGKVVYCCRPVVRRRPYCPRHCKAAYGVRA